MNRKRLHAVLAVFSILWITPGLAQPDSFTVSLNQSSLGMCEFEFYKYNTRDASYEVFTWDGTNLTPLSPFPIRTYRGRINNHPEYKVFAVWYPDNTLYIRANSGKGKEQGFEIQNVDMTAQTVSPSTLSPVLTPGQAEMTLVSGFSCTYGDFVNPLKGDGDYETMVAIWENAVNQQDYHTSRDLGLSILTGLLVIPTDTSIATKADIINPGDYSGQLTQHPMFWKTTGAGGGAGRHQYCQGANKGGRTSMGRRGFGALPHEFGHTLDMGHYHNQWDAMHSNQFFFGRNTVAIARGHLNLSGNQCLHNTTSNYPDPLQPWVAEDYFITSVGSTSTLDVLANDRDYNGDVITIASVDPVSENGGSLFISGNTIVYEPPVGFVGKDHFEYIAESGQGAGHFENYATVSIEVRDTCTLALRYQFEEQNDTVVHDSGWGIASHYGALRNTDFSSASSSGISGSAIHLGGGNDGITLTDVLDPLGQSFSISVWFKVDSIPSGKATIFDSGSRNSLNRQGVSIYVQNSGVYFTCQPEALDFAGAILQDTNTLMTDQWYHAVMIIDRDDHVVRAYLNGEEVSYSPDNNVDLDPAHIIKGYPGIFHGIVNKERYAFSIGHETGEKFILQAKSVLKGSIDEFRMYTAKLSASDVQTLYLNPADTTVGMCETSTVSSYRPLASLSPQVMIFPNPSGSGGRTIVHANFEIAVMEVIAMDGRIVQRSTPHTNRTQVTIQESGLYIITIHANDGTTHTKRLVVN